MGVLKKSLTSLILFPRQFLTIVITAYVQIERFIIFFFRLPSLFLYCDSFPKCKVIDNVHFQSDLIRKWNQKMK